MSNIPIIFVIFNALITSDIAFGEESGLRDLTVEELQNYEFDLEEAPATVKELSLGQQYSLDSQRRAMMDLIARRLGILTLKGDSSDLRVLQKMIDRGIVRKQDVRGLQGLGILFGDLLANKYGLTWVSYEDDIGLSKALRWKKTENYVFPVSLFSKRAHFKEEIKMGIVFEDLSADIEAFIAYEKARPVFK